MTERKDPLDQLIKAAGPEILGKLIKELALARPEIRRECYSKAVGTEVSERDTFLL